MIPMTGNMYVRGEPDSFFTEVELESRKGQIEITRLISDDDFESYWTFPNLMGDELAKKVPLTVVYTTEFDMYRKMAVELRDLLKKNKKLLDFGVLPGTDHASYSNYSTRRSDAWFNDVARVVAAYLI